MLRPEDIERLCRLARLEITPAEIPDVSAKLSSILGLVDQLQAVDASGVAPMAHPLERPQRLRPDAVTVPVIRLNGAIMPSTSPLRPTLSLATTAAVIDKAFAFDDAPAVAISIRCG